MIEVTAWHGVLDKKHAAAMDAIAKPSLVRPNHSWMFDGNIGQFAERWQRNFMVLYHEGQPSIYVTQYGSFNQR